MGEHLPPPSDSELPTSQITREGRYSRFVRNTAIGFGIFGTLSGLGLSVIGWKGLDADNLKNVLLAPAAYGGLGACLGVCLTCAAAPTDFLRGPQGRRWMKLIGTKDVILARMVCVVLGTILAALLGGISWLSVSKLF